MSLKPLHNPATFLKNTHQLFALTLSSPLHLTAAGNPCAPLSRHPSGGWHDSCPARQAKVNVRPCKATHIQGTQQPTVAGVILLVSAQVERRGLGARGAVYSRVAGLQGHGEGGGGVLFNPPPRTSPDNAEQCRPLAMQTTFAITHHIPAAIPVPHAGTVETKRVEGILVSKVEVPGAAPALASQHAAVSSQHPALMPQRVALARAADAPPPRNRPRLVHLTVVVV